MPIVNGKQVRLTQDWSPGNFKITVAQFESNIASGTPPLVVASNTRVPNLNADLLDGVEASAFPLLAGRSGGQTLIGGTASGNDLTLQSTSHATKGKILFGTSAYDEVNNRLGIGIAIPTVPLDVVGDAKITGALSGGGSGHDQFSDFVANEHLIPSAISHDDLIAGTIASHDTVATGAQLTSLTDDSMVDTLHRHSELSASDGSPSPTLSADASGLLTLFNTLTPSSDNLHESGTSTKRWKRVHSAFFRVSGIETPDGSSMFSVLNNISIFNQSGLDMNLRIEGANDASLMVTDAGLNRVGIGRGAAPRGKLDIDQNLVSNAIPVLVLDQADVSEEMIEFVSTIGTGNAIEAVGGKSLTVTHFIKTTIPGGLTRHFAVGTIA